MFKTSLGLIGVGVVVAAIVGWIINLVEVIKWIISNPKIADIAMLMIAKIVGIFIPFIGAILGYV